MKILVKFPSRERPEKFSEIVKALKAKAQGSFTILATCDDNDPKKSQYRMWCSQLGVQVVFGNSTSKIHACNRDMDKAPAWDICVLMSDDMIPVADGWDNIIRKEMQEHFPDTDGVLFHNDGYLGQRLNTMVIIGKKYFDRFGFLYNPLYKSFSCDAEFMFVSQLFEKQIYFHKVLFKHEHPMNTKATKNDLVYVKNDTHWNTDVSLYKKRKSNLFA